MSPLELSRREVARSRVRHASRLRRTFRMSQVVLAKSNGKVAARRHLGAGS